MNRLITWPLLLIFSFTIGFCTGLYIKTYYETKTFKPYKWKDNPIILNCYGEDFSELQLVRAIDYWAMNDNHIAFYEMNPSDSVCKNEWIDGFIILRKAGRNQLKSDTLASTRRYTSGLRMKGAVIWFTPGSQNLTLLIEHELGHAFGYAHVKEEGHIMHPIWDYMGSKFWTP